MANGPFSDAFSDAFDNSSSILPPPAGRNGLRHFRASHFSALRHFFTAHFAGIEVSIIVTPPTGGGGGSYPITRGPGFYTLDPRFLNRTTKHVIITVKLSNGAQWKKHYAIAIAKADIIINVLNWVDSIRSRITIGIGNVKRVTSKVTALFGKRDK